jgi:ATP phosphoribosyltransferase
LTKGWVDIDTVIDEEAVKKLIPELRAAGAEGFIEYPLNKVIY